MKKYAFLFILLPCVLLTLSCSKKREGKPRVLVFSKTAGFVHSSISEGIAAVQKLGEENGFDVDTTKNAAYFQEDSLKKYSAVIFLNTTGNVLDYRQEAAFERYIQAGGGFVGVHAATDTEYDWRWYGKLVGGYFQSHPKTQSARFIIKDQDFPATSFFTDTVWQRTDELYNFKNFNQEVNVILTVDESSYEGGTHGGYHPMSWYHEYDGGRAFYTELGHTEESYTEENYLKHLLGGIQYAIGENEELDYSEATSQLPPDEDRFTKTPLAYGKFFEPTEMTILPNLDILITQRRGEIMMYKNDTKELKQVGFLNVYWKTSVPDVNAEEGVMGIARDPNFSKNNWIYIYYSPVDSSVNRLSRFTFKNDTLDLATEKVILDVKSQREICCHTGGSIAFGPDGLLYLSTGDNSTPFNEKGARYVNSGFAPLNDLAGKEQYDARRSSGNTNDLRGKILRIRVKDDATYEIPEGNLFPEGTEKTRPEIFVMGNRNPYRISIDQKKGTLYWGEVGPDASNDSLNTRGPRGYDEVNQAREAGFFGWPFFVGNNYPYRDYDYATGESGEPFDPKKPRNDSENNTGLTELPPAKPAFIWYPYAASPDFPQVGTGGRNAMAGPVYYTDMFPKETRLPDYYNGKLFIYDWIRGWIKAVTMFPNGDYSKMEPFFPAMDINSLIDMEVGPDGRLYLLEYGSGWFSKNENAALARIDYNAGNRPPKILAFNVSKTTGILPFKIRASVEATDPENDQITYVWDLGNGTTKETTEPELEFTYNAVGDYRISVQAKDSQGESVESIGIPLYAGNEAPKVAIEVTGGNKSFFLPGEPIKYKVVVSDKNDTARFDPANLFVSVDYAEGGYDKAATTMGHQQGEVNIIGKGLVMSLDCKSCHKENEKSIGPSYMQIAQKYGKDAEATNYLTGKILKGSQGVWGETQMPAHPTLPESDAHQIVSWILSLAGENTAEKSLPVSGTITPPRELEPEMALVISATYTDKGGNNIKALTASNSLAIPSSHIQFTGKEQVEGFVPFKFNSNNVLIIPSEEGWFALDSIDLTGVRSIDIVLGWQQAPSIPLAFEVRQDSPSGKLLGKGRMAAPKKDQKAGTAQVSISPVRNGGLHKLYFIFKPGSTALENPAAVAAVKFQSQ
ncbi:MAG TPA: ThuA domain-containing protein [Chryseosolibacter sp.]|nr:ThuA domain-containing protein [Chryseosolibacter sp.]